MCLDKANKLKNEGRYEEALEEYNEILKGEVNNNIFHNLKNLLLSYIGGYDKKVDCYVEFLLAQFKKAEILKHLERPQEELQCYDKVLELKPIIKPLAPGYFGRLENRVEIYDKALGSNPNNAEAVSNRYIVIGDLISTDEEVDGYNRFVKIFPNYMSAYYNKANTLYELGRNSEALDNYDKAIEIAPNKFFLHFNKANVLRDLGRFEEAVESYEEAIELEPNNLEAHFKRAIALGEIGRFEEAVEDYDVVLKFYPNAFSVCFNKAVMLKHAGRLQEANECFKRADKLVRDDVFEAEISRQNKDCILKALDEDWQELQAELAEIGYESHETEASALESSTAAEVSGVNSQQEYSVVESSGADSQPESSVDEVNTDIARSLAISETATSYTGPMGEGDSDEYLQE